MTDLGLEEDSMRAGDPEAKLERFAEERFAG